MQNADGTAIQVTSPGSVTVKDNTVTGGTGRAYDLNSGALAPASITGNTSSGDGQDVLGVQGTLAASWTLPYAGLPVVFDGQLTVPLADTLGIAAGTVLKFDSGAGGKIYRAFDKLRDGSLAGVPPRSRMTVSGGTPTAMAGRAWLAPVTGAGSRCRTTGTPLRR